MDILHPRRLTSFHARPSLNRMDRLLLSQAALPHMMSTLVEDHVDNSFQLLTSGTCDLVRI